MSGTNVVPLRRKKPRTSDIIAEAVDQGKPLPLQVLLDAMWRFLDQAAVLESSNDPGDKAIGRVFFDRALRVASEAAPYLHPKQQSTTISGDAENPLIVGRASPYDKLTDEVAGRLLEALNSGEMTLDDVNAELSR